MISCLHNSIHTIEKWRYVHHFEDGAVTRCTGDPHALWNVCCQRLLQVPARVALRVFSRGTLQKQQSSDARAMQESAALRAGIAQWLERRTRDQNVQAAGECSSPGSTFSADSYFGIRSTPVLPQ